MAIICHRHRFIFIRTRKTAGSSVEIALSRLCDGDDFITPLSVEDRPDETLRRESGRKPPIDGQKRWWQYRWGKELRHWIKRGVKASILGTHATAASCGRISVKRSGRIISASPSSAIPGIGPCPDAGG